MKRSSAIALLVILALSACAHPGSANGALLGAWKTAGSPRAGFPATMDFQEGDKIDGILEGDGVISPISRPFHGTYTILDRDHLRIIDGSNAIVLFYQISGSQLIIGQEDEMGSKIEVVYMRR